MRRKFITMTVLSALLSACGGIDDSGSVGDSSKSTVSFSIADAPVDDAEHVVITIDKVILRRDGATDIVVDRFTIPTLGLNDEDTFQIDLLDYRNGNRLLVIDDLKVPAGRYAQLILRVLDSDVNYSYVDANGTRTPIKQPSSELKLGGFSADADGVYTYILDFDLRKAMTYNPGPDRYILKPRGVRIVSEALASTLSGRIDSALFNTDPDCAGKSDPETGNVVYLYEGHALTSALSDVYDPDVSNPTLPANALNPLAAANVYRASDDSWRYHFGYLPAGNYTLAFSCNAEADAAETFDGIAIPLPNDQRVEVSLATGLQTTCNLPASGGNCAP